MERPIRQAIWTNETIRNFWNYTSQRTDLYDQYFSLQVGKGILNFLRESKSLEPGMKVLDFGCGLGFLLSHLLSSRLDCYGFDYSNKSVDYVNNKFRGADNWKGAVSTTDLPTNYSEKSFDLITCIETLEHLLDNQIPGTLDEINRLLKPGGMVLFTTPFEERLSDNSEYCPFCQTKFHRFQHVRSFSIKSLSDLLAAHGFNIVFCHNLNLADFQRSLPHWSTVNAASIYLWMRMYGYKLLDLLHPRPFPDGYLTRSSMKIGSHLCALVERI